MCMKENIPPVTTPGAPLCEEGWTFFQVIMLPCNFYSVFLLHQLTFKSFMGKVIMDLLKAQN